MKSWFRGFNTILWLLLAAALAGCESSGGGKKDKEASTIRFHLETNPDGTSRNMPVSILRANPVTVQVEVTPFIDEGNIQEAAVVEQRGGFAIQVLCDSHARLVLENVTTAYRGRRVAIYSQFGATRWLAAPMINSIIRDGIFTFTPDCSREEADRLVRGLNNVAKALEKSTFFKEPKE